MGQHLLTGIRVASEPADVHLISPGERHGRVTYVIGARCLLGPVYVVARGSCRVLLAGAAGSSTIHAVADGTRREAALSLMGQRFPAVAERVARVHGLRVPRHLMVFCALWASADVAERAALDYLGVRPFGLTQYFADDGLRLAGRDGLDERLQGRYRRDPAELVTVLSGGTDGLHFGLWYDDPAELPSLIAHNYARDSAETRTSGAPTLLAELGSRAGSMLADYGADGEEARLLAPLADALGWFAAADREALEADGERRWAGVPRQATAVSIFPALPAGSGDPRLAESARRVAGFGAGVPEAVGWIDQAGRELAAGLPAFALAVGMELHWTDLDQHRRASRDLLTGAYRALGREALAAIVEVHTEHRDLTSVNVLTTMR